MMTFVSDCIPNPNPNPKPNTTHNLRTRICLLMIHPSLGPGDSRGLRHRISLCYRRKLALTCNVCATRISSVARARVWRRVLTNHVQVRVTIIFLRGVAGGLTRHVGRAASSDVVTCRSECSVLGRLVPHRLIPGCHHAKN